MLLEWAPWLGTPAPTDLRRFGYLRESVSLQARSCRCRAASRAVVCAAFAGVTTRRRAVVFGSGLLDDVPLADLAAAFAQVVLVDAVHPWPTRRLARRHRNVVLVSADLGGTGRWLLGDGPIAPVRCPAPAPARTSSSPPTCCRNCRSCRSTGSRRAGSPPRPVSAPTSSPGTFPPPTG